jgi:putative DNA primase/helicase
MARFLPNESANGAPHQHSPEGEAGANSVGYSSAAIAAMDAHIRGDRVVAPGGPHSPGGEAIGADAQVVDSGVSPDPLDDPFADASASSSEGTTAVVNEATNDPHRLARLYLNDHQVDGVRTLVYWHCEYHLWDGSAYRKLDGAEVKGELVRRVKKEFDRVNRIEVQKWREGPLPKVLAVTTPLVANVFQALASLALLPGSIRQPSWLSDDATLPSAGEMLPCRNGLLHLPTGKLYRPTPQFFSPNALDYDYDPDAPEPKTWFKFLGKLWDKEADQLIDDTQSKETLQEWFGYNLTPGTSQQKIMMLVGPPRAGKGVISRTLTSTVGEQNVCGPTLANLGTNFGLSALVHKTVAIISDARISGRTDVASLTERLLSISGEDGVQVDRKFLPPMPSCRLLVRFTILTNELPRLNDASGALVGRLVILRLTRSWLGREDHELVNKLLPERPGILRWAIEGWRHLHARGHFVQPESGKELRQAMKDLNSPISTFLRDRCEIGPAFYARCDVVYEEWKSWCKANGGEQPGVNSVFARDLHAAVPGLKTKQKRMQDTFGNDIAPRCFFGLRLKPL